MDELDLVSTVARLNSWDSPQVGRSYQHELLTTGCLAIGDLPQPYVTLPIDLDRFELRPLDPDAPTLITTDIGRGWEIVGVLSGDVVLSIPADPSSTPTVLELETDRYRSSRDHPHHAEPLGRARTVRIGHGNFAHFLWNNLPATILWETTISDLVARGEVRCEFQPDSLVQLRCLGSEHELLPLIAPLVEGVGTGWPDANTIRLGSVLVTEVARRRTMSSLLAVPVRPAARPRLWLGVRHPSMRRSPRNLDEFFAAVAALWCQLTTGDVIVDGYTIAPEDEQGARDLERQADSDSYVGDILRRVHERLGTAPSSAGSASGPVIDTMGVPLRESLALAGTADFYVSCPGTTQHKIGWVWNSPGIVLNPPIVGREHHSQWCGRMVENGFIPLGLPDEFVRFTERPESREPDRLFDPYVIVNVEGAARWVVDQGLAQVARTEG